MAEDKEQLVQKAKLAEQAERSVSDVVLVKESQERLRMFQLEKLWERLSDISPSKDLGGKAIWMFQLIYDIAS